jgi:RNA polymerase sigma-70 factor (ECF subfamily)
MYSLSLENELISRISLGDTTAVSELWNPYQPRLRRYIYAKTKDASLCDDLLQDTFIKAFLHLKKGSFQSEGKFFPWLLRIAHNVVMDHFRQIKRQLVTPTLDGTFWDQDQQPIVWEEPQQMSAQINQGMYDMIAQLPEEQKQVVQMRIFQDMSFKEISEATGVSINTALGRMRYALINLRKELDKKTISIYEDQSWI